jgi:hypothetical protein
MSFFKLFKQLKSGTIIRPTVAQIMAAAPKFHYDIEVYDRPRHLYPGAKMIDFREADNLVTREGLGYLLGCAFQVTSPATKKTNFFVTQIKTNTTQNTTDTATTPGATEIVMSTDVSQTVRPTLTLGAVSTGADLTSCDNSASKAVFNHLTTITVYGLKLYSINAAGTSSGYTGDILYGGTLYATALAVQNGYEVDVQATLSATAG